MIVEFFLNFFGGLASLALGGYVLFFGRRTLWFTLGVVVIAAIANLLDALGVGVDSGWKLLGMVVTVSVLGVVRERLRSKFALTVIGFTAGADMALWLYEIATYLITAVARLPEQLAIGIGLVIIFIGGLLGIWLVRNYRDDALILIAMFIGTELILDPLGLSETSSWTAIIILSLALAGVLVQYADYLRELKADTSLTTPEATSGVAFFQALELDQ